MPILLFIFDGDLRRIFREEDIARNVDAIDRQKALLGVAVFVEEERRIECFSLRNASVNAAVYHGPSTIVFH